MCGQKRNQAPSAICGIESHSIGAGTRLSRLASSGETRRIRVPTFLRRVIKVKHLDLELASWQLAYLCVSPRMVYKQLFYHKQTKNTWARDDPAIVLIVCALLCITALAWGISFRNSIWTIFSSAFLMVFRDFLGSGLIAATITWLFARVFLIPFKPISNQSFDTSVEWAYAFDIHTNAFFPFFLSLYVLQFFLYPLVSLDRWICLWLGNTIYLVAMPLSSILPLDANCVALLSHILALPFLVRSRLLLFPLIPLLIGYVVSLLGFNISRAVVSFYFARN
ncbi:UNC-50 [Clavulina sp. PMI_390]|nr:UNC-50 [Clavulina sp. PMI_390]